MIQQLLRRRHHQMRFPRFQVFKGQPVARWEPDKFLLQEVPPLLTEGENRKALKKLLRQPLARETASTPILLPETPTLPQEMLIMLLRGVALLLLPTGGGSTMEAFWTLTTKPQGW